MRAGDVFLGVCIGYVLRSIQDSRRSHLPPDVRNSLPADLLDKAERIVQAGGQVGLKKVGDLLELSLKAAVGDQDFANIVAPLLGDVRSTERSVTLVEQPDGTWRPK